MIRMLGFGQNLTVRHKMTLGLAACGIALVGGVLLSPSAADEVPAPVARALPVETLTLEPVEGFTAVRVSV